MKCMYQVPRKEPQEKEEKFVLRAFIIESWSLYKNYLLQPLFVSIKSLEKHKEENKFKMRSSTLI